MPIVHAGTHAGALRSWWRGPTAPLVLFAAIKLALHLATNATYGFQRDEMYYIASGQHPALGYVDYPPVTPMLARLDTAVFGIAPWTLRLLPAIVGAILVVLTGLCAREMGGGRSVQALAAFVALICPLLLGSNWLFQTVTFDQLTWLVAIYLVLRILNGPSRPLWLLLGLDLGIGLETKLTIIALGLAIAVTVVTFAELRSQLRTRWPWVAAGVAAVLAAPNFAWQAANGFPTLTYIRNHSSDIAQSGGIIAFLGNFLLFIGPLLVPLWIAGMVFLFRDRHLRPAAVVAAIAILLLLPEGKAYYPAPTILFVLAAGCVGISRLRSRRQRRRINTAVVVAGLIETALLIRVGVPIVPQASLHAAGLDTLRQDFADTVGWPELTAQVGAVYDALPTLQRANTVILANNYGEAGAIDIYGRAAALPQALSPHLSFWYWKPQHVRASTVVTVGYNPSDLAFLCGSITVAGHVLIPDSVTNQEQGTPILVCTNLRETVDDAWPQLKSFE